MKKVTFLIICCFAAVISVKSQGFYNFQQKTAAYYPLTHADTLIAISSSPNVYAISLPLTIHAYGYETAKDLTIGAGGFIVSTGSQYSFAFDIFLASIIPESGNLLMEWDTIHSDKHLLFEWRNFKLQGHPVTDYVNFTIDFNLKNEVVEFHYGPSEVTSSAGFNGANTGPTVIMALLSTDFNQTYDFGTIGGDPANPTYHNSAISTSLNAVPNSGTVYRFEPVNISLEENQVRINVYPNPVKDVLEIEGIQSGELQLMDLEGKTISTLAFQNGKVNLSHLPSAYYLISIVDKDGMSHSTLKVLKE